jgi:hypothetical protein
MGQKYFRQCIACLLLMSISFPISGQSLSSDLGKVSKSIEDYFRLKRPEWKHQTIPPGPLGTPPSPNIVIHQWSSEKCLTAEVFIDGKSSGKHPVSCRIKLAIDRSESASAARARLSDFVMEEHGANPISVGDKGYVWGGTELVFVKGKFTFWLGGNLSLRVGDFSGHREFMDRLAKEVADAVPAT